MTHRILSTVELRKPETRSKNRVLSQASARAPRGTRSWDRDSSSRRAARIRRARTPSTQKRCRRYRTVLVGAARALAVCAIEVRVLLREPLATVPRQARERAPVGAARSALPLDL